MNRSILLRYQRRRIWYLIVCKKKIVQRRRSRFSTTDQIMYENGWTDRHGKKYVNFGGRHKIRIHTNIEWRFQCWRVRKNVIKLFIIDDVFTTLVSYENYSYFVSWDICFWYLWFVVRMNTIIDFEHHWIRNFIWVGWPVVILSNLLRLSWRIKKEWKRLAVDAYISRRLTFSLRRHVKFDMVHDP